jgi:cysteinyl-tRNA synthetase
VGVADDKRDPRDFALWKRAEKDHILRWRSPWGEGYPGWHLECSVMSMRYIGDTLDIHGGGLENIFPHHECEIAQSEAATGKPFVRYWLHNNMVTVDGRKMGKSLGNYITLKDLFGRFAAPVVRLYILRSHYRKPLDFSDDALESARSAQQRIYSLTARLSSEEAGEGKVSEKVRSLLEQTEEGFFEAMDDDLNTPMALAAVFDLVKEANSLLDQEHTGADGAAVSRCLEKLAGDILGIDLRHEPAGSGSGGELLELLAELRGTLRAKGLYDEADSMRDRLEELGFAVMDLPDGSSRIHSEGT